ncbi:MAG: MotA/TolQ/ExbB proton channel family protein [Planctomycetales bacterium]
MLYLALLLVLQQVPADDAPSIDVQPAASEKSAEPRSDSAKDSAVDPKQPTDTSAETSDKTSDETPGGADDSSSGDPSDDVKKDDATDDDAAGESSRFWMKVDEAFSGGAIGLLRDGGFFMWPLLLMAIIATGVIMERYRSLKMMSTDSGKIRAEVSQLLQEDRVEEALALCDAEQGPIPAILSAGLRKYLILQKLDYDPARIDEQVVKGMDDYGIHIIAALERHLPILATISSAAPMLGFLGTVQGMIVAFKNIVDQMGETNIVEAAAAGIQVSLLTTCFGLIVGIPAFVAFNYFTSVINQVVLEVEESATELVENVTLQLALREKE